MTLTFLGTGTSQGIPIIGCKCNVCKSTDTKNIRLRSSAIVNINDVNILIDCGPDFRQQMLISQTEKIDAILITHHHQDHVGGIDDVRPYNFLQNSAIEVYASKESIRAIKNSYSYVFAQNRYPSSPLINTNTITYEAFEIKGIKINPIKVMHGNMEIMGFKIGKLAYITDASFIENSEIEKIKNCNTLIINALRHEAYYTHFNLEQALEMAKIVNAKKTYFTHISHQMGLHQEINDKLPENIFLAHDQLKINIDFD